MRTRILSAIILLFLITAAGCSRREPTAVPLRMPELTGVDNLSADDQATESPTEMPSATQAVAANEKVTETVTPEEAVEGAEVASAAEVSSGAAVASLVVESPTVGQDPVLVRVVIENASELYGAQFHVNFDAERLQVMDADEGLPDIQIVSGEIFVKGRSFAALNRADNDSGKIDFAATRLNPAKPVFGEVELASFAVQAKTEGTAELGFAKVLLSDRDGNSLPVVWQGVSLEAKP